MSNTVVEVVFQWLKTHGINQPLVIAYSGGRDSHVLLDVLCKARSQFDFELSAVHINHGLHPDANAWATHCAKICGSYGIAFNSIALQLTISPGESVENVARQHRYRVLSEELANHKILLTAHTLDDQAETFLLQLLRGGGTTGLAGMGAWKRLGKAWLARPLLEVCREDIAQYASNAQLSWIEDSSNLNLRFRRNFLRHQILPALQTVYPGVAHCIARSARHCASSQQLLDEYLDEELNACLGTAKNTLKISVLQSLPPLKQQYVIRHWLKKNEISLPSSKKLKDLVHQALSTSSDSELCVKWDQHQIRRYRNLLYILSIWQEAKKQIWDMASPLHIANDAWTAKKIRGRGIALNKLKSPFLQIAFRVGGERVKVAGSKSSRSLKKILQEKGIPCWQRSHLPLLYQDQTLIGVGDLFVCEGWQVEDPLEEGWVIERV